MASKDQFRALRDRVSERRSEASELYAEAAAIVAQTPSTRLEASTMVGGHTGPAGKFYDRERRFKDAEGDDPVTPGAEAPGNLQAADIRLSSSDEFLYRSVVAAMACNRRDAQLNLHVARAILDEAERELRGATWTDWSPPAISGDLDNRNECD